MGNPRANFEAWLTDLDGRTVPGSRRYGHNIFTRFGKDWLAELVRWTYPVAVVPSNGSPPLTGSSDAFVGKRRFRWIGVGTGTQLEDDDVQALVTPAAISTGPNVYIKTLPNPTFPTILSVRYTATFGPTDFGGGSLSVSEAGIFVDVDSGSGPGLSSLVGTNRPVAYKLIDPALGKTGANTLTVRWEFRF